MKKFGSYGIVSNDRQGNPDFCLTEKIVQWDMLVDT
jgi:hypothetical protein